MPREVVLVTVPLKVTFAIERDPSGIYVGLVNEYPGVVTQGRTRESVKRKLIQLLREISREHPEELHLFA